MPYIVINQNGLHSNDITPHDSLEEAKNYCKVLENQKTLQYAIAKVIYATQIRRDSDGYLILEDSTGGRYK